MSFAAATAVVMAIALAASLFPALRASRTDPLTALRHH
jgi:ABC-type lipoprotein release transport system permease subunit